MFHDRMRCPPRARATFSPSLAALLAFALLACDVFDRDRRPYTPFPVASGKLEKAADAAPAPPPAAPLPPAPPEALVASSPAPEWRVAGRVLAAPPGLAFRLALVGGLRGGADDDVLAWLVGTPEREVIGQLWFYPAEGEPRLVLAAPTFLPTGPGCTHGARLSHAGPSTVTLDIKASCRASLLPRAPERSVSVVAPLRSPPLIVGFRVAAPAPGERLELAVTADDRDGDGRDDVELTLGVAAGELPEARARFVWLQRAAGLSRDMAEPRLSFVELAAPPSGSPPPALDATQRAASVRRLYASMCADSAVPRIFLEDGAALPCGDLSTAFEALTLAEMDAALARGDVLEAFAALERHDWFPTSAKDSTFRTRTWAKLEPRVARRRVIKQVLLKAPPRSPGPEPHLSPLTFHADGSLLVQTAEGVVRAAPDGRYEYDASAEVDRWPLVVASPAGEQLTGLAFPCDRSEVVWLRSGPDGSPREPLPAGLIAPRPGNCGAALAFTPPEVGPIGWTGVRPGAFIGASRVGDGASSSAPGSALSPNGRFGITSSRWGLLVSGGTKTALWRLGGSVAPTRLVDCVINDNAQAAACVHEGRAVVLLPDPKSG